MTNFPFELSKQVKHIDIVKTRTACINDAFTAIETAKLTLSRLEEMAAKRADGKLLDIHTVGTTTHSLRNSVDRILVGLIESQTIPGDNA